MASRRVMLFLAVSLFCLDCSLADIILRPYRQRLSDEVFLNPPKRPFCNAFTGCGGKRSVLNPMMSPMEMFTQRQFADDSVANDEDLTRRIMTGAELWEALREASAELARKKEKYYDY